MRALGLGTAAIVILGGSALLDRESGFGVWLELGEALSGSEARIARLEHQNEMMRREIEMLKAEPAAIDRAIREELDLALPGETIVRFERSSMREGRDSTDSGSGEQAPSLRRRLMSGLSGRETK